MGITLSSIIIGGLSTIAGIIFLYIGLFPFMVYSFSNSGALVATFLGALLILFPILYKRYKNIFIKILWILTTVISVLIASICVYLGFYSSSAQYNLGGSPTIVVMGCQVKNGMPSLTLANRLEEAYKQLEKYPNSVCVVTGGLSSGEPMSEAEVMYNYLAEKGIDKNRIIMEDKSTSTDENIKFTSEIIKDMNLSKDIIITTDNYHQFRSAQYAKRYNLNPYSAPSKSLYGIAGSYYIRELFAMVKFYLF